MARLKPLNVRRTPTDDDDRAPRLGSARARLEAQRDYVDLSNELRDEDDDRRTTSYKRPMD